MAGPDAALLGQIAAACKAVLVRHKDPTYGRRRRGEPLTGSLTLP